MTTAELTTSPEVLPYLKSLERRIGDLPKEERVDILGDLESHLEEILKDEAGTPLVDRIGTPGAYAEEFAASIGLEDVPEPSVPVSEAFSDALRRLSQHPIVMRACSIRTEMRPVWWTLRGAAIGLPMTWNWFFSESDGTSRWILRWVAAVIVLGIIGVSMRIGRNQDRSRGWKWLSSAATIAGIFAGLLLMTNVAAQMSNNAYYPYEDQGYMIQNGDYLIDENGQWYAPTTTTVAPAEEPPFIITP